jgi:hypothetical protein
MAEPPSLAGAVHVTVACALPAVAVPMVGAPGAVAAPVMVVLVMTGGAPYWRDAGSGRVVTAAPVYAPVLGHPSTGTVREMEPRVMFAAVLNSNWLQLMTVPVAPDAVRLTVTDGVVNVAPDGICVGPVEISM